MCVCIQCSVFFFFFFLFFNNNNFLIWIRSKMLVVYSVLVVPREEVFFWVSLG